MTSNFPLYDQLASKATEEPIKVDVKNLAATLANLPEEHSNIIFLLIHHHYTLNNKNAKFAKTPYGGNVLPGGKGITFPATSIPPFLKCLIFKYLEQCVSS